MHRALLAGVVGWLLAMLALAAPRQVGDASEYVAMAANLASLRPPALTAAEMHAFTERHRALPGGFELQTRQLPELVGDDGRQDMPHMWTYALLAVPGVWAARLAGRPDAWGLVALNVVLLTTLLCATLRRSAGPWTLLLFAGPFIWWIDKPVADLLVACAIGLAVLAWPAYGWLSLVVLGVAAAQNPALAAVWLVFAAAAVINDRSRLRQRRWWVGATLGAAIAATAPLYYLWHLGRLSPLTSYTTAQWPSVGSLLFPIVDLNMGALTRFTPGALAVGLALCRREGWRAPAALPALGSALVLLAITSQQPNRNNGGHPDLSRYVVWLWPLALPWLQAMNGAPQRWSRHAGVLLLMTTAAWSTWQFRPTVPERYRYPTALADWVWRTYPAWTTPIPESFSERVSHREPGWAPVATAACEKVLLYEGTWPWSCPPAADAPQPCRAAATFCYADHGPDHTPRFRLVGTAPGVGVVVPERRWTHADRTSAWLAGRTRGARVAPEGGAGISLRAAAGIGRLQLWVTDDGRVLLHAHQVGAAGRVLLRHKQPLRIDTHLPGGQPTGEQLLQPGVAPTTVALPPGRDLLLEMRLVP